jgi:hypothetical protein
MSEYLLSTYAVEGAVPGAPRTPEEMGKFMERVSALEAEMDASGTFVFGGALHSADAAKVPPRRGRTRPERRTDRRVERADRRVLHHQGRRPG